MLRGARSARDNTGDGESVLLCGTSHGLSLIEPALKDMFGNTVLENLGRAAGNHPAARPPHAIFRQRFLTVASAAHHLYRIVSDIEAGLIAGELRQRGIERGWQAIGDACRAI